MPRCIPFVPPHVRCVIAYAHAACHIEHRSGAWLQGSHDASPYLSQPEFTLEGVRGSASPAAASQRGDVPSPPAHLPLPASTGPTTQRLAAIKAKLADQRAKSAARTSGPGHSLVRPPRIAVPPKSYPIGQRRKASPDGLSVAFCGIHRDIVTHAVWSGMAAIHERFSLKCFVWDKVTGTASRMRHGQLQRQVCGPARNSCASVAAQGLQATALRRSTQRTVFLLSEAAMQDRQPPSPALRQLWRGGRPHLFRST